MDRQDIATLRELAGKVRDIAGLPVQQENIRLWQSVNDLQMIRPVLHLRDCPLYLLQTGSELVLTIEDPFLRSLELDLKLRLYEWEHLRLDRVIEPVIYCHCIVDDSEYGLHAEDEIPFDTFLQGKGYNRAVHYEPQIRNDQDLEKIKAPVVVYREEETLQRYHLMQEIFAGILEVRLQGRHHFQACLWDDLLKWMGISEGLLQFALEPDFMHRAAEKYLTQLIDRARQYERLGILSSNNGFINVGNNGIGYTTQLPPPPQGGIGARLCDIWGENADQILTAVSPEMSEEFAFAHEQKWAALFGLYSYGCCERLDHKIAGLRRNFKNLRKISLSPFARLEAGMEQIGSDYVVCFKPNSNYLAGPNCAWERLRAELLEVLRLARKYRCNVEIDMKTLISLNGEPERLWAWCDMASELVRSY